MEGKENIASLVNKMNNLVSLRMSFGKRSNIFRHTHRLVVVNDDALSADRNSSDMLQDHIVLFDSCTVQFRVQFPSNAG